MAGRKGWKKSIPSGRDSFYRRRAGKTPARAILIIAEGEVTEPVYFEALRDNLALQTIEIVVHGAGKGDPKRLAEEALEARKKRKRDARNGDLPFSKAMDFDELWIVFDTEAPERQGRYHDGVAFAKSNNVQTAGSTPCFEYWLLLHRRYTTAPMAEFSDVKKHLKNVLGGKYAKNRQEALELIPPLLQDVDSAVARAEKARKYHLEAGTPDPANPSTDVDRLINSIRKGASPANK